MAIFPLDDLLTNLKDGVSRALRISGETKITNTTSEPVPTTVTGSLTKEFNTHSALAITDTVSHDSNFVNISSYTGRKNIIVANTLNQAVTVKLIFKTASGITVSGANTTTINAGIAKVITSVDIPELLEPAQSVAVRLTCAVAPSSGSVSTFMEVAVSA